MHEAAEGIMETTVPERPSDCKEVAVGDPEPRCPYFAQVLLVGADRTHSTHTLRLEEGRGWTTQLIRHASSVRCASHGSDLKAATRAFARSISSDPLWETERVDIYWACMDAKECACDVYEKASWWPLQVRLMLEDGLIGRYSPRHRARPPSPSLAAAAKLSEEQARSDVLEGLWEVMCITEDRGVERPLQPPYTVSDTTTTTTTTSVKAGI
jgi:hypothetical protein